MFSQVDVSERNQTRLMLGRLADSEGDLFTVTFSGIEAFNFLWPSFDAESGDINLDLDFTETEDWGSLLGNYTIKIIVTELDDDTQ